MDPPMQAGVAIFISDKAHFRIKLARRVKVAQAGK
jgi:hypothetical protein